MIMKRTLTQTFAALLLMTLGLLAGQQIHAQDIDVEVVGYANVFIKVKAVPGDGGKVFPFYKESSVKVWRDEWDYKQAVPVGTPYGVYSTMLYLYANSADDYVFAGWYLDDGDGEFDIEKDEFLSDEDTHIEMFYLDDDVTLYETQAQAKSGTKPTEPSDIVFAYFTNGATVSMSYYQDDAYFHHGNCGSVWISKQINSPGDEVTVRAIPNDGYHFAYWQDASRLGNIVSTENPYTFTVQGGEHLYAYFMADDAPEIELPEEGGFAVVNFYDTWVLSDESIKNGAMVLFVEAEDMTRTDDGKVYLDMSKELAQSIYSQWRYAPTVIYGKGKVTFAYKIGIGIADELLKWSGSKGVTLTGEMLYAYVFVPELGAFIQYGTTDDFSESYTPSIKVPANLVYFTMSAYDLTDDEGNIPLVIGLSPETYDKGVAGRDSALEKINNPEETTEKKGDVNGDGSVDVADISAIISVMSGETEDNATTKAADINGDGTVDVADISAVISIMAGEE